MAIYHFSAQVISRSQGRSAVAAAAYRAGAELHDERLAKTYNFEHKNDVINDAILTPEDAPDWTQNREVLWNAVEAKENRKDAQVAREINIALPKELTEEQNWQLALDFVREEFVAKGMIADVSFHAGNTKGEEGQPHVHIMLTTREITKDGFGLKTREWNAKDLLLTWRENWATRCNLELTRLGLDMQIDHRSLDAQGIDLEPQSKIGAKANHPNMARYFEHQELAHRNGERIKENPGLALDAMTRQQSTFSLQDMARFVNRHTDTAEQFTEVYQKLTSSAEIVYLGKNETNQERYTTRAMLKLEQGMLANAKDLYNKHHPIDPNTKLLAMLDKGLSEEQQQGFLHVTGQERLSCIVGFAGTGKSYMLGVAKEAWELEGFKVQGATLSGIAAQNLEAGANIQSHTVANRLWHWEHGREQLTAKDVLVVDEAGMLGSRQMASLLEHAAKAEAKVVLVGDPEQLQAIEAGAPFRAIAENLGYSSLTDIRRQTEEWQKEATKNFAQSRTKEGLLKYEEHDNIHVFETNAQAIKTLVEAWDENRSQSPEKSQIILAYTKFDVRQLNNYARSLCRSHKELGEDFAIKTTRGARNFAIGDRVYFLRNENQTLHVKNGTLGTVTELDGQNFKVKLDVANAKGLTEVSFNTANYQDIEHGYAATVHKAQGITVDRAHVLASRYFDRHTTYVAMTRHREGADLYYSRDEFSSFNALARTLGRERSKDVTLDYSNVRNVGEPELAPRDEKPAYNTNLTAQREHLAEQRLAWRQTKSITCNNIEEISQITKFEFKTELQLGDTGIYMGTAKIGDLNYKIISQEEGRGFLVDSRQFGIGGYNDRIVVDKTITVDDKECFRATNLEKQAAHEHKQQLAQAKEAAELQKQQEQLQRQMQRDLDRGGMEM